VLAKLLAHPSRDTFDITIIVRGKEKAKEFEKFGIKAVAGSFKEDLDKVEELAESAHVVFSCVCSLFTFISLFDSSITLLYVLQADADDMPSVKAILKGLKQRHAKEGDLPILIHTVRIHRAYARADS
jgi:hypothetical protein